MDGETIAEGRDGRPNPTEVLVATVNEINDRGMTVKAGEVVTTGPPLQYSPSPADAVKSRSASPDIGDVELSLT